jgi:hypothetical protein
MLTNDALQQMAEQHYEVLEAGHHRLRADFRDMERRLDTLDDAQAKMAVHVTQLDTKPIQATELHFTPAVVLTIVSLSLSIAGGMWASTYGLRSDVRDILTSMAASANMERVTTKLNDERAQQTAKTIETIDKKLELQRLKIESLNDIVLRIQPR